MSEMASSAVVGNVAVKTNAWIVSGIKRVIRDGEMRIPKRAANAVAAIENGIKHRRRHIIR